MITITQKPALEWGRTAHEAVLTCPHGTNSWTVFGDEPERLEKARMMAPAHRSLEGCKCEVEASAPVS